MLYTKLFEKEENNKYNMYSKQFIEVIATWQEYGIGDNDRYVIEQLNKLNIPNEFKKVNSFIYRVMALEESFINDLTTGKKKLITNEFSSWSLDLQVVESFQKDDYFQIMLFDKPNMKSVFFKFKPSPEQIFINLHSLWTDKKWVESIEYFENQGINFESGLAFEDEQKEVILRKVSLNKSHILKIK